MFTAQGNATASLFVTSFSKDVKLSVKIRKNGWAGYNIFDYLACG